MSRIPELIAECKASDSELAREAGHTLELVVGMSNDLLDKSLRTWEAGQKIHSATLELDYVAVRLRSFILGIEGE